MLDLLGRERRRAADLRRRPGRRAATRARASAGRRWLPDWPTTSSSFVNKHALSQVHGCEARYLAERDETFDLVGPEGPRLDRPPGHRDGRVVEGRAGAGRPGRRDAGQAAPRAATACPTGCAPAPTPTGPSCTGEAVERVTTFFECFPPLKSRVAADARRSAAGRAVRRSDHAWPGKYDLSLGAAQGINRRQGHRRLQDRRVLARPTSTRCASTPCSTPSRSGPRPGSWPRYYLDSGQPHPESVTVDLLEAAVARTIDGVIRIAELDADPRWPASDRPGPVAGAACSRRATRAGPTCARTTTTPSWTDDGDDW